LEHRFSKTGLIFFKKVQINLPVKHKIRKSIFYHILIIELH
jgi:hypothetical protein